MQKRFKCCIEKYERIMFVQIIAKRVEYDEEKIQKYCVKEINTVQCKKLQSDVKNIVQYTIYEYVEKIHKLQLFKRMYFVTKRFLKDKKQYIAEKEEEIVIDMSY